MYINFVRERVRWSGGPGCDSSSTDRAGGEIEPGCGASASGFFNRKRTRLNALSFSVKSTCVRGFEALKEKNILKKSVLSRDSSCSIIFGTKLEQNW